MASAAHTSPDQPSGHRAIVLGATGATGRQVVKALLDRNWEVTTITRRHFDYYDPSEQKTAELARLTEIVVENYDTLTTDMFSGHDALFNCLGTTRGQAGSAEAFVHVEVGLTELASAAAKAAGVKHVSLVSAQGANKDAWVPTTMIHPMLYMRTLGEKEDAVVSKSFPSVSVYRPGMLDRLVGDRAAENFLSWLMPSLTLRVDVLARAMVKDAEESLIRLSGQCEPADSTATDKIATPPAVRYVSGNSDISRAADRP